MACTLSFEIVLEDALRQKSHLVLKLAIPKRLMVGKHLKQH